MNDSGQLLGPCQSPYRTRLASHPLIGAVRFDQRMPFGPASRQPQRASQDQQALGSSAKRSQPLLMADRVGQAMTRPAASHAPAAPQAGSSTLKVEASTKSMPGNKTPVKNPMSEKLERAAQGTKADAKGSRTIIETSACPIVMQRRQTGLPWKFADLEVKKIVGEGHKSSVAWAQDRHSGLDVAIKMYHTDKMSILNCRQVAREIEIHAATVHPAAIKLYAAFEDAEGTYLVQEFASGGDLYAQLAEAGGFLHEDQCAGEVMVPFLSCLGFMHARGIMHRDIKPENMLLTGDYEIRLADFGLAIDTALESPMSRVGTLDYMPPEIVRISSGMRDPVAEDVPAGKKVKPLYGLPADVWGAGVLAYELLVGGPPFEADTKEETHTAILSKEPYLPSHLSMECKDFLRQALAKDPAARPTVVQLQRHPFLAPYTTPEMLRWSAAVDVPKVVAPVQAAPQKRREFLIPQPNASPQDPRERRDSHKPAEYLELKLDSQLNLARAQPVKGHGGGAAAGASPAGAAPTPRNTTATDADRMSLAKDILITPQGHTMQRSPQEFTIPAAYGPGAAQLGAAMQGLSVSATPRNTAAAT